MSEGGTGEVMTSRFLTFWMPLAWLLLVAVCSVTDEVAVMYGGGFVEHAPTDVLFSRMRHPYTQSLMGAIPRLDAPAGEPFTTIEGEPPNLMNPPAGCVFADRCPYKRPVCRRDSPPLTTDRDNNDRRYACFFPLDSGQD